jgi:hypothetical protein
MTRNVPAIRMRRLRERAKHGSIFVRFEMTPNAVDRLIALGWLNSESRRNPYAVTVALIKFGTRALWPDQRGSDVSH